MDSSALKYCLGSILKELIQIEENLIMQVLYSNSSNIYRKDIFTLIHGAKMLHRAGVAPST